MDINSRFFLCFRRHFTRNFLKYFFRFFFPFNFNRFRSHFFVIHNVLLFNFQRKMTQFGITKFCF
ncbi:unnamed protein product [Meloidogyne enterolobii]|uniref:Uncharacterized protein n=1 Tax=Meloidogyne enterolobii TaxID=390850 RepID=A0ACB0XNE8_MELEN